MIGSARFALSVRKNSSLLKNDRRSEHRMKELQKPRRLEKGDTIATVSPCNGWAGDPAMRWKYELGVKRLKDLGLNVVAAPHSLRGHEYLSRNPEARAEDLMWAFENPDVKAIIANVGGDDSIKIIPHIDPSNIKNNPKIFIGYSDVMNLHILCYKCGLSSFYGDNLLVPIADAQGWHEYSKKWFTKVLFDPSVIGSIEPSKEWTYDKPDYMNQSHIRKYHPNNGYELVQGKGSAKGRIFGGHTGLMELCDTPISLSADDFNDAILFIEDLPEFFSPKSIGVFLEWLRTIGALSRLKGMIIGKISENSDFREQQEIIRGILSADSGFNDMPVLYGLNFGHTSPMCILPYGAMTEIDCESKTFSILENGVL